MPMESPASSQLMAKEAVEQMASGMSCGPEGCN